MGSFAGISIDAQNLKEAVSLAEQKKYAIEQQRLKMLSDSLIDYKNSLPTMGSDVKFAMPQYDSSNNVLVQKKPYLVVQEFNILNKWENRMGQSGVQELPQPKNTVIFLPLESYQVDLQNQYDVALKDGKLKPLDIVTVESLVDKQIGKCKTDGSLIQTMEYNPCRTVKKGELLKGYVVAGTFTPYDNSGFQRKKPALSFNEFKVFNTNDKSNVVNEPLIETKKENGNKLTIMIIGAFILGYLLTND